MFIDKVYIEIFLSGSIRVCHASLCVNKPVLDTVTYVQQKKEINSNIARIEQTSLSELFILRRMKKEVPNLSRALDWLVAKSVFSSAL